MYLYNIKTGQVIETKTDNLQKASIEAGWDFLTCKLITEDEAQSLMHEDALSGLHDMMSELGDAIKAWEGKGKPREMRDVGDLAIRLNAGINDQASKKIYWIAWIKDGQGNTLKTAITIDKAPVMHLLLECQKECPAAILIWKGPMDYMTGMKLLESGENLN